MLSELQKQVLAVLGKLRDDTSYVAGGSALNVNRPRISDDIDIFHDAEREVVATAQRDVIALREAKFSVSEVLMQYGLAEVVVKRGTEETTIQWMGETVLRFFPLQRDPIFGYRLHEADLAVNKAIASASRRKVRDIVDLVAIGESYLKLGPLVWAAADSKTPMSPKRMIEEIIHNAATHSAKEYGSVRAAAPVDGAATLAAITRACEHARAFCESMPVDTLGKLFIDQGGQPVAPTAGDVQSGRVILHGISDYGAWPSIVGVAYPLPGSG
jgi:hypothetical protein